MDSGMFNDIGRALVTGFVIVFLAGGAVGLVLFWLLKHLSFSVAWQ